MTETLTQNKFDAAGFEAFAAGQSEPAWRTDMRRESWKTFEAMDWPSRRSEEWIRSDLRMFKLDQFHLPAKPTTEPWDGPGLLTQGVDLGGQLTTLDSQVTKYHIDPELEKQGVIFGSLEGLAEEHGDLIQKYLFSAIDPAYDRFAALHAAFSTGGNFLYVPRGVAVRQPLHVASLLSNGETDLGHTLIVMEEGSEAVFLHEAVGADRKSGGLHLGAVEIIQKPGSHLRYVDLQDWGYKTFHFAHQKAVLARDATIQWTIGALGAGFAKVNQSVELTGPGAESQVNGVLFTEGRQHLAYHTLQHHVAPSCRSDFLYAAAQQDHSRTVWRGMIKVDPDAQKTNGYQRNDNLVLSSNARADSIPGLEIEADDVRCTHGSTTSKVDEEQIFYAMCRGFTRGEAVRMIVTGFFQKIFDRITIDSVREAMSSSIARQVRDYA